MNAWSEYAPTLISMFLATVVLITGLFAFLRRKPRAPRPRLDGPARPSAETREAFEQLVAASRQSAYSRDRIQERIRALAMDIAALTSDDGATASGKANDFSRLPHEGRLAEYLSEDHAGFKGANRRATGGDFLEQTHTVVEQLEDQILGPSKEAR